MQFKEWLVKEEESVDRGRQLDKATLTTVKPNIRVTQLGVGTMKKGMKKR